MQENLDAQEVSADKFQLRLGSENACNELLQVKVGFLMFRLTANELGIILAHRLSDELYGK